MVRQDLVRGQMLVAQGEPSDALFVVLHGALAVRKIGDPAPIAELRAGELVGEIGFFANVPRTADVIAIRDTSVLVLTRAGLPGAGRGSPGHRRGAAGGAGAAVRQGDGAPHPVSRLAEGANGGADRRRIRAAAGRFRSPDARGACRDRCRDRRSRPPRTPCFPAGRWMRPRSPTGSTRSNRPRRWWFISAVAKLRPGRARPSARPTWSCSSCRGDAPVAGV